MAGRQEALLLPACPIRMRAPCSARRPPSVARGVGPLSIEGFFMAGSSGMPQPPQTWKQWRLVPEQFLAVSTNGAVFSERLGAFTAFREALLGFYPEDVRLKDCGTGAWAWRRPVNTTCSGR